MVTTFTNPVINKKAEKAKISAANKERCRQLRLKTANRKGILVNYLRDVVGTENIRDYVNLRNIVAGHVYMPDMLDKYEAYVDSVLAQNQNNHEPII